MTDTQPLLGQQFEVHFYVAAEDPAAWRRSYSEVIEKGLRHDPLQNLWMVDIARIAIQRAGPCLGP
jgi:hypothetical protein